VRFFVSAGRQSSKPGNHKRHGISLADALELKVIVFEVGFDYINRISLDIQDRGLWMQFIKFFFLPSRDFTT
jgi:hypothetical protein